MPAKEDFKRRLVKSVFTVTLVEYCAHESEPTTASLLEEIISTQVPEGCTCLVEMIEQEDLASSDSSNKGEK